MTARASDRGATMPGDCPPLESLDPSLREGVDVARDLGVDPATGLSAAQAARRLDVDGRNELESEPPVPLWRKIMAQFHDPFVYLLLAAASIALIAWAAEGAPGVPIDAVVIGAVVILNATIGFIQERRAENAVAALQAVTAARSTVLRDGELLTIPSSDLVRGDIMVLSEGDAVGADGRLLTAAGLRMAEAELTGESAPVTKSPAALGALAPLGDRTGMVYRGTGVAQGVGRAVVTGTGMSTEVGAVAAMLKATEAEPSPLRKEIARVSKSLGIAVIVIAVVVMIVTAHVNRVSSLDQFVAVLLLGVSLAVAAVPEGLPAIVTVVLALGVERMAQRRAVVKDLHSVETLGCATVIASDKTGTLTQNQMTIRRVLTASGTVELTGIGYRPDGTALFDGRPPDDRALRGEAAMVIAGGALANDAQLALRNEKWEIEGDPTEAAFLVAAHKLDGTVETIARFHRRWEVPFTSDRKMMSAVVTDAGSGATFLVTKGAPDVLLTRCVAVQVGDQTRPLDEHAGAAVLAGVEALSAQAFRTLAVAYRRLGASDTVEVGEPDENDLVFLGVVGIIDPPREEVPAAVADARRAGVRVVMVTGDYPTTAARIAQDLGIAGPDTVVVTGADLDAVSAAQLSDLAADTSVYARVAPKNKLQIVRALQARGEVVAVTGDGVNDAPALKAADIGIAMGTGTEVTKQAGHMILGDDNFATIVAAVRQGRVIFDDISKFLRYLLSSNVGEVFTVFFGIVFAGALGIAGASGGEIAVPLLATQILWINLVTDAAPALAIGVDPETEDVMLRRPRRLTDRIIDLQMWAGIMFTGAVMAAATLLTMDVFLPGGLIEGSDSLEVARTAGFTTLVVAQLFNAFNSRSPTASAFRNLFTNRWLWTAVALGLALQIAVVHVPFLQAAFGTAPLKLSQWGVAVVAASSVLWLVELRKLVLRATTSDRRQRWKRDLKHAG
ncbi:cation-translocating P-type ATPase [Mycolicibacterium iranicum]|uniref:Haloacid dehalogenase n=1 Tax=Mycolicibacterium iranicum TaxID=912594 RepID=A0A178LYJ3_MYCIR|nr:cation-translocating P-type ATPase [Mycolicibacterium iranicum]OAN39870.1 haloacid dehalogenase [Mycolicibacterium iranicum]